jgi:hypothetical protein
VAPPNIEELTRVLAPEGARPPQIARVAAGIHALQTGTSRVQISKATSEAAAFANSSIISLVDTSQSYGGMSISTMSPPPNLPKLHSHTSPSNGTSPNAMSIIPVPDHAQSTSTPDPAADVHPRPTRASRHPHASDEHDTSTTFTSHGNVYPGKLPTETLTVRAMHNLDANVSVATVPALPALSALTPATITTTIPNRTLANKEALEMTSFGGVAECAPSLYSKQPLTSSARRNPFASRAEPAMVRFDKGTHVMLSYQWNHKKRVVAVEKLLRETHSIPTWIDIDNMGANVYDSMAEGVQGAAAIVCFMTDEYKESRNCQLELKFAQQAGVPIIPVKFSSDWKATGWLGLITAGGLWISLDGGKIEDRVSDIADLIFLSTGADGGSVRSVEMTDDEQELDDVLFTVEDVREELSRLQDEISPTRGASSADLPSTGGTAPALNTNKLAALPAIVPADPLGFQVTEEMKRVREFMLAPDGPRQVGVCGMGGAGKTVVTAWMSRLPEIRGMFRHICWVIFGQVRVCVLVG